MFRGVDGETYPMESGIPWVGAYGTNHQYIGSEFSDGDRGLWVATGLGPHTPESNDYNAGANGIYMWLKDQSWLYAKWDFPWGIDRTWSALRVTQITPEPATLALVGLGTLVITFKRRRSA